MAAADLRRSLGRPKGAVSQVGRPLLLRPGLFDSWADRRDHHVPWRDGGPRQVSHGRAGRLGTGDRETVRFGCRSIAPPARLQPPESEHEGRAFRLKFRGTCWTTVRGARTTSHDPPAHPRRLSRAHAPLDVRVPEPNPQDPEHPRAVPVLEPEEAAIVRGQPRMQEAHGLAYPLHISLCLYRQRVATIRSRLRAKS